MFGAPLPRRRWDGKFKVVVEMDRNFKEVTVVYRVWRIFDVPVRVRAIRTYDGSVADMASRWTDTAYAILTNRARHPFVIE